MRESYFTMKELCRSRIAKEIGINNEPPESVYPALARTISKLNKVRHFVGHPFKVHSGYRCKELNTYVGGKKDSQHLRGEAVDFTCPAYGSTKELFELLAPRAIEFEIDQIILEHGWIHISFSESPRKETLVLEKGGKFRPWKATA